jgi:AcrR family transcriptional regulator
MGRPAARDARDTRQAILDAALDLFSEAGFHAASMRALAAAVGVRESAIYHHFPSKEGILEALFEIRMRNRAEMAERIISEIGDHSLAETLQYVGEMVIETLERPTERKFIRLIASLGINGGEEHIPFHRSDGPRKTFNNLITELQRRGRMRSDIEPEVFLLEFVMPIFVASGAFYGGRRMLQMTMQKFLKHHIATLVRGAGR